MRIQEEIRRLSGLRDPQGALLSAYLNWERRDGAHGKRIQEALRRSERRFLQGVDDEDLRTRIKEDFRTVARYLRKGFPSGTLGICVFVSSGLGLFESHPLPVPFKTQIVVAPGPFLLPLARVSDEYEHYLVALVDTESARILEIAGSTILREEALWTEVPGRHSQGGWSQMRYQRHIEDHRDRHHRETADRLTRWVDEARVDSVLLAGQDRILANFQEFLPERLRRRIQGVLSMDIRTPQDEIQWRCQQLLQREKEASHRALVLDLLESVLTDGSAVVGVKGTVRSLNEGKLGRLVASRDFASTGALCAGCEMLHWEETSQCPYCGGSALPVPLEQELINAALRKGADAVTVVGDPDLERHGDVGGFLRYR